MAREATELVNYLEFDHRSTGKRKRAAVEQQQPVSVAAASLEPRACIERSENEISSKRAPAAAEKLWDGSLQLSSSVHVSAVAFFKSGEKMFDVQWSDIAEVKGKVRLDAFEKYIQDLSRSRNRRLMVVSLCWKEGSSKSGLVGMQKVAESYKEWERVGFVKLSPGVDLYVCTRSDAIITILAKHGFFKGMAAILDYKDSLIGCVVRRKLQASTSSATKKLYCKNCSLSEKPLNSSFGSSNHKSVEKDSSREQPIQKSIRIAREKESSTLESTGNWGNEVKHLKTDCTSLKGSMSQSSEVEAPPIHKSSMERTKLSLVAQEPVLSLPSDVTKQPTSTLEDLPEFDFGTGCGIFLTPKSVHAATVDTKLLTQGSKKMDGLMHPTAPTSQSPSTFNQRSEILNPIMFQLNEIQRMPFLKKVNEHGEPQTAQSRGIRMPVTATAVNSKNLFKDDDMHEWRPQKFEISKLSVPQVTSPSVNSSPLEVPNPMIRHFSFIPPITSPTMTSVPLKAPNSTLRSYSLSLPRPSPPIIHPSITFGPLKVSNSTLSFSLSHPRPSLAVLPLISPSITSYPLKVPNSSSRSFSLSHPVVAYPDCFNHAFPRANYYPMDTTVRVVPQRLPEGYAQIVPGSSMVISSSANPQFGPPPNSLAVKLPVNPVGLGGCRP
ncbi:hypothetical protein KPL70_027370 [Citrus sinensis]|uniref:Spen paralogue and orthologue SPOC C-terminal domain-containing protein n=2 Tax=Citrus clementina TaxID=85681 RepID=V4U0G9_CITCL|nr:uncharacterized protein LOC18055826 isoform X1 [Citrus x clementina]XP_006474414.1 uncharacterized protein LOC102619791 [Citrus sinensis]ESR66328.1 hypothetical protein CICLE_v10007677mg [Citrus x clementina]KAH9653340.1 hypothetical protein KPL70_027370 [Citrus sinensis]